MYSITQLIYRYYTPVLCALGALGNSLSLLVFCKDKTYRNQSAAWYLSALAVSDTLYLVNVFAVWLEDLYALILTSDILCPLIMYLGQVTCFLSVYLILVFSLERYIAVYYAFSRLNLYTASRARKIIAGLILISSCLFLYVLKIAQVVKIEISSANSTTKFVSNTSSPSSALRCSVPLEYHAISEIANYLDTALTLVIPFLIICFTNQRIAKFLKERREHCAENEARESISCENILDGRCQSRPTKQKRFSVSTTAVTAGVSTIIENLEMIEVHEKRDAKRDEVSDESKKRHSLAGKEFATPRASSVLVGDIRRHCREAAIQAEQRATKTLLLISSVFALLNLPLHLVRCTQFIYSVWFEHHPEEHSEFLDTMHVWANMLFNTNFAINFFLYCASGRKFRKSLKTIIC